MDDFLSLGFVWCHQSETSIDYLTMNDDIFKFSWVWRDVPGLLPLHWHNDNCFWYAATGIKIYNIWLGFYGCRPNLRAGLHASFSRQHASQGREGLHQHAKLLKQLLQVLSPVGTIVQASSLCSSARGLPFVGALGRKIVATPSSV